MISLGDTINFVLSKRSSHSYLSSLARSDSSSPRRPTAWLPNSVPVTPLLSFLLTPFFFFLPFSMTATCIFFLFSSRSSISTTIDREEVLLCTKIKSVTPCSLRGCCIFLFTIAIALWLISRYTGFKGRYIVRMIVCLGWQGHRGRGSRRVHLWRM